MTTKQFRIVGPPGTGKSSTIEAYVRRAVEIHGALAVRVASLTRAAAAELVSRDLELPNGAVGTLHAHAYHALNRPPIAEDRAHIAEWNTWIAPRYLDWQIIDGGDHDDDLETFDQHHTGDGGADLLNEVNILRAQMVPHDLWTERAKSFWKAWSEWMNVNGYTDFTGLIEKAVAETPSLPGTKAFFLDEAQDLSRLEMKLARQWGEQCDIFAIAGDPDQAIFEWRGASPEAFYEGDVADTRILEQSYRIPMAVWEVACEWIEKCSKRVPAPFYPRPYDGKIIKSGLSLQDTDSLLHLASNYTRQGLEVMILASCSYMLDPIKAALRAEGTAFHNPYRRKRGDWNPLGGSSKDRLLAFLHQPWTPADILKWSEAIRTTGVLARGYKMVLAGLPPGEVVTKEVLEHGIIDSEEIHARLLDPESGLGVFESALGSRSHGMAFPLSIVRRHGIDGLQAAPRITLGTIHSVKGGGNRESVVILAPDLSPQGYEEWMAGGLRRDAVIRLMYVGITRAKETLILLQPTGRMGVNWL